jgi:hypothetical protein
VDLGSAAAAVGGDGSTAAVLVLNSSLPAIKAQARQLVVRAVDNFLTHAALLEGLKNSGAAAAAMRGSDGGSGSDDIVMVEAPPPPAAAAAAPGSGSSSPRGARGTPTLQTVPPELSSSLHPCAVGLQMLLAAQGHASLHPLLAAMLPGVLQLQELSGPGLQQLVGEAQGAFVQYKYLPLSEGEVTPVIKCVLEAGGSESWSTRAAGMVYLQVFWFRHCYLLQRSDLQQLQVGGFVGRTSGCGCGCSFRGGVNSLGGGE